MTWIKFFVGTPQRFLSTLIAIAVIAVLVNPQLLTDAVQGLLQAVTPLLGPVLSVAIMIAGFRIMFGRGK